jgi:hypothetical protein
MISISTLKANITHSCKLRRASHAGLFEHIYSSTQFSYTPRRDEGKMDIFAAAQNVGNNLFGD